jgi:hypothetical protein
MAPRGFIPWERKFEQRERSPTNHQKEGSWPLGHTAASTYSQPNPLMRVSAHFHQQRAAGLHFAPRGFIPWDQKFDSENTPPIIKKKARGPLVTPPPAPTPNQIH